MPNRQEAIIWTNDNLLTHICITRSQWVNKNSVTFIWMFPNSWRLICSVSVLTENYNNVIHEDNNEMTNILTDSIFKCTFWWKIKCFFIQIFSEVSSWQWVSIGLEDACLALNHYPNQCWPRSMVPYGVTMPQWLNWIDTIQHLWHHRNQSSK